MKLRFLPLALCLLIVLTTQICHAKASVLSFDIHSKSLAITAFKAAPKKVKAKTVTPDTSRDNPDQFSPKSDIAYFKSVQLRNPAILQIEENSYKKINSDNVSAAILTNSKAEISKVMTSASTFRQGMFYGFAIMVILLNLICYFLFEEKLFMNYSLAMAAMTTLFFYSDGLFAMVGIESAVNNTVVASFLLLTASVFATTFASNYLLINESFPKLRWVSYLVFGAASVMFLSGALSEIEAFLPIVNILAIGIVCIYFMAGVALFSKKNYPKFYVIACSIPLLFAIDFFVLRNLGVEFLFTEAVHLKVATLVEMLIITYAIMYRMRAIKEENRLRQTELRIFLKRQEVMNRKTASQLMEDVYLENLIMHYDLDGFEIKLLQYISEGKDNAKIARKLKTTEAEIEEQTKELYHKLEISEHIQEDYRMVNDQPDYIYN
jgi:DNA-binding CsgD family transcriptional regulator